MQVVSPGTATARALIAAAGSTSRVINSGRRSG